MSGIQRGSVQWIQPLPQQTVVPEHDSVSRYKVLFPRLRECLTALMNVTSQSIVGNSSVDLGVQRPLDPQKRGPIDRALEDFKAICECLETELSLSLASHSQALLSLKHATQIKATLDHHQAEFDYTLLNSSIQSQINMGTELRELLEKYAQIFANNGVDTLNSASSPPRLEEDGEKEKIAEAMLTDDVAMDTLEEDDK